VRVDTAIFALESEAKSLKLPLFEDFVKSHAFIFFELSARESAALKHCARHVVLNIGAYTYAGLGVWSSFLALEDLLQVLPEKMPAG